MPENGVFHNLILAKIKTLYPGHAEQIMHAFWGVGQMSFVKHAIFVGEDAPPLRSYEAIAEYILARLDIEELMLSRGVVDALDHSSNKFGVGGKLGIDATGAMVAKHTKELLSDAYLLQKFQDKASEITHLKQYFVHTANPITLLKLQKERSVKELFEACKTLYKHTKIIIAVDDANNDLDNLYMLVWRVVNNIDANRDFYFYDKTLCVDTTNKNALDGFTRRWPDDVSCTPEVLDALVARGLLEIDADFKRKFLL
jgi:4-hydroxy-3-polyprenylbenzoate decarboxylase